MLSLNPNFGVDKKAAGSQTEKQVQDSVGSETDWACRSNKDYNATLGALGGQMKGVAMPVHKYDVGARLDRGVASGRSIRGDIWG